MAKLSYLRRASKRFIQGTGKRTPWEAVEAGLRSLTDWAQVLDEERERDVLEARERSLRRRTRRNVSRRLSPGRLALA